MSGRRDAGAGCVWGQGRGRGGAAAAARHRALGGSSCVAVVGPAAAFLGTVAQWRRWERRRASEWCAGTVAGSGGAELGCCLVPVGAPFDPHSLSA